MRPIPCVAEDPEDGLYWPMVIEETSRKIIWINEHSVATPSSAMELAKHKRDRIESPSSHE